MFSVFDKVFKRPERPPAGNRLVEPHQTSLVNASQDDSKPDTEITATELASPQSKDLSRDIVFIDGAVENISHLLRELDPAADLYVLHLQSDGLEQISDYLSGREDLLAVHLFCNGGQDFLKLGSTKLTNDNLSRVQLASLMRIGAALAEQSDFLIYGCELGTSEAGAELVSSLSEITGADIAVSPKVVGSNESSTETIAEETTSTRRTADGETANPAIVGKTNGSNGTVVFDLSGNITYVADPGYYGEDSFEYKVGTSDNLERLKVHVNIVTEDEVLAAKSVAHFNVLSEGLLTSVTSNHGLSPADGELLLGKNDKFELVRAASDNKPSTLSVNLQKLAGEGSPSFKIAVAPSNFVPTIIIAEPIENVAHQDKPAIEVATQKETPPFEASDILGEAAPEFVEQIAEPEIVEPECVMENTSDSATEMPLQFEDFSGGTLSFPFDPQLQEPALTGNSILGQLIIDSYVRPGTLFLDVNNSFDPREQGVVSQYLVKQADGSPLPEHVHIIRDGFFTIDQNKGGCELELLIEAELLDGHIVSRAMRVNVETGSMEALAVNRTTAKSNAVAQAPITVSDGSQRGSRATNKH